MSNSTQKSNLVKTLWLILLALVVLILLTIFCALPKIYQNIYDKTAHIIAADEKYSAVEFHTDKTQVYLTGFLASEDVNTLKGKIADVFAVSKVEFTDKTIEVLPEYDKVTFSLLQEDANLTLEGEVSAIELVDFADDNLLDYNLSNKLATNKNLPLWWDKDQFEYLLSLVKSVKDLNISLDETLADPSLKVLATLIDTDEFATADLAETKIKNQILALFPDTLLVDVSIKAPEVKVEEVEEPALYALAECQAKISEQLKQAPILFARAKSNLNSSSKSSLNEIADIIDMCEAELVFAVGGHADSRGNDSINVPLSKARARQVVDYLIAAGIAKQRFTAKGYSSNEPVADNASEEGRKLNRRIEIDVESN